MEAHLAGGLFAAYGGLGVVVDPVASDQQAVGVDAVGRTGQEGDEILPLLHSQGRGIIRLYDLDLVHLVGQGIIEDMNQEMIPHRQLVEIRKEARAGQSSVS